MARWACALALLAACPGRFEPARAPVSQPRRLVTTERGPHGGRLIFIGEDGRRLAELTRVDHGVVVDGSPAWSPDGRFVVFASSRGRRSVAESNLWVVAAAGGEPHPLSRSPAVERDPRISPDGASVVYAANLAGNFDLYRLPIGWVDGQVVATGAAVAITSSPLDELSPSLSPAGDQVVYMQLDRTTQRSTLWRVALAGGAPTQLTPGPADVTPALSPDGKHLAFASPVAGRADTDLFLADADGQHAAVVVDEPDADETGPVWSADGRYLFATAVFRSAHGDARMASVVFADLRERPPLVLRALHDDFAVPRWGLAVAPVVLDAHVLHLNPTYGDALHEALTDAVRRNQAAASEPP